MAGQDHDKFRNAHKLLNESLVDEAQETFFSSDNIITWGKNLSFLRDDFFINILRDKRNTVIEKTIIWRTYVLLYFAKLASKGEGDFIELGCYTGYTPLKVIQRLNFERLNKAYYLYDLFEWKEGNEHTLLDGHKNPTMYADVKEKFSEYPFIKIIKGSVPQSFEDGFPNTIAFAHFDMNVPEPTIKALAMVLPRLSSGGVLVFSDYGWWEYSTQNIPLNSIIAENGLDVLELPTGQGLLIKG